MYFGVSVRLFKIKLATDNINIVFICLIILLIAALYYNRAVVFHRMGATDESLKDVSVALELAPIDPHLYVFRGNLLVSLQRYKEAMTDFHSALILDDNIPLS